jgi:hypothetical protein
VVLIDDEDLELVSRYRWWVQETPRTLPYAVTYMRNPDGIGKGNSNYGMHRLLTGVTWADHRNGNTLDNRRSNLRTAGPMRNAWNRRGRQGAQAGFKGVNQAGTKTSRWQARIMRDGKRIFLGNFDRPEEAARAYDAAARSLFGEFAWVNFPEESLARLPSSLIRNCARPDCGEEFRSRLANAIFCSDRCAKIMSKRRVRARQREAQDASPAA